MSSQILLFGKQVKFHETSAHKSYGNDARRLVAAGRRHTPHHGFAHRSGVVDSKGMTLYVLDRDQPLASTCYGRCARVWPPLWAPVDAMYAGAWTAVERPDGSKMWAYRGRPLYRYVRDEAPGMVTGEGVVDRWGMWHAARAF
jgi:predicted lipoprotein with Yx(FWY)xxD motif